MRALDKVSMNQPTDLIDRFTSWVDGDLNESSLGFLNCVNKANPAGFAELLHKLQTIQVKISAATIHLVVQALTDQLKISHNAVLTIQAFMQDEDKQVLLRELDTHTATESKLTVSVFHIMNQLNIFTGDDISEQFLRTVLSVMLEWESAHPQLTIKDAVKWLKSVLNIPYKSFMAQIIQLLADHIHLSDCLIPGKIRNMDGLELFFLLKNLTLNTPIILVTEENKAFMLHMHATILTIMIYKNSQNAFYDVVALHESHSDYGIFPALQDYQSEPLIIEKFFKSSTFKPYFSKQRFQTNQSNQHIFMSSCAFYLHSLLNSNSTHFDPAVIEIVTFIKQCKTQFLTMDKSNFAEWFQQQGQFKVLEPVVLSTLLHVIYAMASLQKSQHAGRIRASAMQLVSLGFSHRSASTVTTGGFKPLVNTDIAAIDTENIKGLNTFFAQQSSELRIKLIQEMILGYMIYSQNSQFVAQADHKKSESKAPIMATLNQPSQKVSIPQAFRSNPLDRNRMFNPKPKPLEDRYSAHEKVMGFHHQNPKFGS